MMNDMVAGRIDPNWNGPNIFTMVLGFVFFWPVGLVFLYMILTGRDVPGQLRKGGEWLRSRFDGRSVNRSGDWSGNRVFDDHLRSEYARLEREKERLESEKQAFATFLDTLGQERDRQIFEQWRVSRVGEGRAGA